MKKPLLKITDRITKRPHFVGQTFKGVSRCIPGQAVTPQEIIKQFTSGMPVPKQVYVDGMVSDWDKLDAIQKIDYLNELKRNNHASVLALNKTIEDVQKKDAAQKAAIERQQLTEQIRNELKNQNATTINDDAK